MHGSAASTTPRGTPSRRGKSPRFTSNSPSHGGPSTLPATFAEKPVETFVSSLSIRVEGATPIESPSPGDSNQSRTAEMPQQVSPNESKRAPRKSKTDALAALNTHARSSSIGLDDSGFEDNMTDTYRNVPPIPVSPRLDLSTVKTLTHKVIASDTMSRPFGLEDCPVFRPTTEEFKDPMDYIRSISDRAKGYGICKIVPPDGWEMPFVTDTEKFRFTTRLQRLNSIEASSRAKLTFLEQLYRFHKQQGNPRVSVPTINHKPLDLWLLRKEVQKLGGYDAVTKGKKWSDLGRILGYRGIPGLSTQIKNSYTRVILPYEHFCERGRNSPSMSPATRDPQLRTHLNIPSGVKLSRLSATVTTTDDNSPPSSPLTTTSSPLSEPPDESEYQDLDGSRSVNSKPRRSTRTGSHDQVPSTPNKSVSKSLLPSPIIPTPIFYDKADVDTKGTPEQNCEICHKKNRGEEMLLCDGCDCGFHMFCLDPPLDTIPKEQWFCFTCISGTGGDFGFDEGEEHSLSSFQARDKEFRRMWFNSHPPPQPTSTTPQLGDPFINRIGDYWVTESDVEKEFWRLVQSPHETVEIEYGADVHSTTHGSAMPTMETHPLDPYSKDPWNLNNIPIVSDSLLRFIKSDISGMTVPWTYVGMAFSTFCWHNEDHYTYSVNFMHWGETKTWYGIPGEDAEKFEAAIKCEAPDLFAAQPDLLFQLVTLMNPERLKDAGVHVFACNQRAGEFVITFPKAYHAGFNHGLNFNEAVNFALPDWLPYGRECVQRYREHRKLPVFSHDELVITITQQSQSIKTAMWLIDSLKEMVNREISQRTEARALGLHEKLEEEDRSEDQYQCTICKSFCYLSQITCQCTSKVVCVDHADLLCEHSLHQLTLRNRFSDEDLYDTLHKVDERAEVPSNWRHKLGKLLLESARPSLRSLRALLAEGDRINYPLSELATLRKCVGRANEWIESANTFIIRKQGRKRPRRSRGRPSSNDTSMNIVDDPNERSEKGLDDLYALLREVENLGFDCPEIGVLRTLANQAEGLKAKARNLLDLPDPGQDRDSFIQECERLIIQASSMNVHLEELLEVEKIVMREQLIKELEDRLDESSMTLEEVRELLTRARACNLPVDHKHMRVLEARQRAGDSWEERAKSILIQPYKTIDELDDFVDMDPNIPIDPTVLDRLMSARAKAKDLEKQAKLWLSPESDTSKPKVQDVMRLVTRAEKEFSIPAIQDLKRTADIALDLETRCDQVLKNRYHRGEGDVFETMHQWKTYAEDHLKMFLLPSFEKLDEQLRLHRAWLENLPYYCEEHRKPHGKQILEDVIEATRPEDDLPPSDEYFTCICTDAVRPPPPGVVSDAVQCDHCFARFHGLCAANGNSCPFCDHHHWNGAIHKERSWHFCFLPGILAKAPEITKNYSKDWKQLEVIVHRIDRLSGVIGQFLSFASQSGNQRIEYIHQVRHYMRKLYKIQFVVSPNPEVSFGLDLAGLHRILAGQPSPIRARKRRRPRFTFGQDIDKDWSDGTRCICRGRTSYLHGFPKVECELCNTLYHAGCVFYDPTKDNRFTCPLCCLRKNRPYAWSDVRVKPMANANLPSDMYVNTKEMLDTFSKEIIYKKMLPPYTSTLFVELERFIPGQPENIPANPSAPRAVATPQAIAPMHSSHSSSVVHGHEPPLSAPTPASAMTAFSASSSGSQHVPPTPPWSRWGTMSTPSRPPSTQRRQAAEPSRLTPQPSRKRKHVEEPRPSEEAIAISPSAQSPKRRAPPHTPMAVSMPMLIPTRSDPPRPIQTLSPSLAMIVSPTDQMSPRGSSSSHYESRSIRTDASPHQTRPIKLSDMAY